MKIKKILITTTAFAPENEIGVVRVTKIVKYLVRLGYDITVISPELHEISRIDNSLLTDEIKSINKHTVSQSNWFNKLFLRKRNAMLKKQSASNYMNPKNDDGFIKVVKAYIFSHLQFLYTIIRNWDWKNRVTAFIEKNYSEEEFDLVISSYPSLGGVWSASWVKKNKYAKVWYADFRDPINYDTNSSWLKLKINTYLQDRILAKTDLASIVSKDLFPKFSKKYHHKLKYLPNGFDTDDLNTDLPLKNPDIKEPLTFCYVGSLYGGVRKFKSFFNAINALIKEGVIDPKDVKLVYAGKEFDELHKQATQYNLTSILHDRGSVSRSESIQIQNTSDVIIVVTWNTKKDQGVITGKLFECFLTKKTILGIVNGTVPDSEFKNMIEAVNGGFAFEESSPAYEKDFEDLISFIEQKYTEKKTQGFIKTSYDEEKLEYFSHKNITKRLVSYLENLG